MRTINTTSARSTYWQSYSRQVFACRPTEQLIPYRSKRDDRCSRRCPWRRADCVKTGPATRETPTPTHCCASTAPNPNSTQMQRPASQCWSTRMSTVMSVSVCPLAYVRKHMSKLHQCVFKSNQIILFAHKIQICFTHDSTRAGQTRLLSCYSCPRSKI